MTRPEGRVGGLRADGGHHRQHTPALPSYPHFSKSFEFWSRVDGLLRRIVDLQISLPYSMR